MLKELDIESHLVMTDSAKMTLSSETSFSVEEVESMASVVHSNKNIGATIASGSYKTMGMVVAPCSIRSLSEIAYGITTSLLTRSADVVLKERRRLVLMVRETPLHLGHLRAMTQATEQGALIVPPVPAFYSNPQTIEDIVNHSIGRVLDLFDIDTDLTHRWTGLTKNK